GLLRHRSRLAWRSFHTVSVALGRDSHDGESQRGLVCRSVQWRQSAARGLFADQRRFVAILSWWRPVRIHRAKHRRDDPDNRQLELLRVLISKWFPGEDGSWESRRSSWLVPRRFARRRWRGPRLQPIWLGSSQRGHRFDGCRGYW